MSLKHIGMLAVLMATSATINGAATLYLKNNNKNGVTLTLKYGSRTSIGQQSGSVHLAPGGEGELVVSQGCADAVWYNFDDNPGRTFGSAGNVALCNDDENRREIRKAWYHVDGFGTLLAGW
jgi:hypothetical protein